MPNDNSKLDIHEEQSLPQDMPVIEDNVNSKQNVPTIVECTWSS